MSAWPGQPQNRFRGQILSGASRSGRGFYYGGRRVLVMDDPGAEVVWAGQGVERFTEDVLRSAFEQLEQLGLDDLRSNTPVDSSDLQKSDFADLSVSGGRVRLELGATEPYAIYVELGTSTHRAQPFIRPTFDRLTRQIGPTLQQHARQLGGGS